MNDLKTPVARLARLFRDARDRWRAKALERQQQVHADAHAVHAFDQVAHHPSDASGTGPEPEQCKALAVLARARGLRHRGSGRHKVPVWSGQT